MPSMDDIYVDHVQGPACRPVPRPVPAVPVPQAQPVKVDALARFAGEIGSALKADALDWLNVKVVPVETLPAANVLADQRAKVKLLLKDIEDRRKKAVEPLKREAAAVDAEAHRWTDPLKSWDKDAERVLLAFQRMESDKRRRDEDERQRLAAEAAQRQAEAEQAGNTAAAEEASREIMRAEAAAPAQPVAGFKTDSGTTSLRRRWAIEVIDPALVPDAYLVPSLPKLQAAVDAGAREIEGCSIEEKESLPVRTRA